MKLYSTNNPHLSVTLKEAVLKGLPDDNGLFMPDEIPALDPDFIAKIENYSFQEIAFTISSTLLRGIIPDADLKKIITQAIIFPAPIVSLHDQLHILELFHGPSLAFKDFGARFMAQLMSYFLSDNEKESVILVATSGDTGGAVASGFYQTKGIRVVILYPSGKVSHLQEKQLTALGHNITALEVQGTFDDCQALVKKAFLDKELTHKIQLSSANSINIARLIPQMFYYFEAYKQLLDKAIPVVFSVPSGNFGNLTAGIFAKKMGLPVHQFLAATNANDVVPSFLQNGVFKPRPSVATISNAMDVGNPSNFARMNDVYCSTWNNFTKELTGYSFDDEATRKAIIEVYENYEYIIEPHGAVAYLAYKQYQQDKPNTQGIILETAHPSKFNSEVEDLLGIEVEIPERLAILADKKKNAVQMNTSYEPFKQWLLDNF